jgi:hypothetical protein
MIHARLLNMRTILELIVSLLSLVGCSFLRVCCCRKFRGSLNVAAAICHAANVANDTCDLNLA